MAAVDFFLKLDGIGGESQNSDHKGEIEVLSFSWGVSVREAANGGGGGGGAAKATFDDLVIVKHMDRTSPALMLACSSGKHIKLATFAVVPAVQDGGGRGNMAMIKLEDVIVESVRQ